jgi:protease I
MLRLLEGTRVAILATDGVEQSELTGVREALDGAGAKTDLLAPGKKTIQAVKGRAKGDEFPVDVQLEAARTSDYAALYLPGGVENADSLRTEPRAVQFVREFMALDKPVAAICHGPRLLIEADSVAGRQLTSWPSLKTDIRNAGGEWVDEPVHADGRLITSMKSADIPEFSKRIVAEFVSSVQERRVDQTSEQSFPASDPPPGPASIGGAGASESRAEP